MSDQDDSKGPFLLGVTMAGAVSAGAYTAGVLDFLLCAMDAHNARCDPDAPPEDIPWGSKDQPGQPYSFLATEIDMFLTTTNLMGVPYEVSFAGGGGGGHPGAVTGAATPISSSGPGG